MNRIRNTTQREVILEYLKTHKNHPTAETVYEAVREQLPSISLGTVYRNINELVAEGEVLRLFEVEGKDRFDGGTHLHAHFLCTCCGQLYDFDFKGEIGELLSIPDGFEIKQEQINIRLSGTCNECKIKTNN